MWDLTVQDDHDFYVESATVVPPSSQEGSTAVPVLVHNCPTGTATYRWDPVKGHATIQIDMPNGTSRESHQVVLGENPDGSATGQPTMGQRVPKEGALGPNAGEITFDLPDPQAAWDEQTGTLKTDLGPYNIRTNSCITYCVGILRAGGVDIPEGASGMLVLRSMYRDMYG